MDDDEMRWWDDESAESEYKGASSKKHIYYLSLECNYIIKDLLIILYYNVC